MQAVKVIYTVRDVEKDLRNVEKVNIPFSLTDKAGTWFVGIPFL